MQFRRLAVVLLLSSAATMFAPCFGQNPPTQPPPTQLPPLQPPNRLPGQATTPEDQERQRIEKEMAKKANHERQVQLKRDTEQLLKLATELKAYVDKSSEDTLSLDVIKKAEAIEKLAHSVKEKMKGQ